MGVLIKMKLYRTEKHGVSLWKLSGVVGREDLFFFTQYLKDTCSNGKGCLIIDFENVMHVDYKTFRIIEDFSPASACILLSGLSDYLLDIYAFASPGRTNPVYSNWREALSYLIIEKGKLRYSVYNPSAGKN